MTDDKKYNVEEVAQIATIYSNLNTQSNFLMASFRRGDVSAADIANFERYWESYEKNVPEEVRKELNEGEVQNLRNIIHYRKKDLEGKVSRI